jgi:hypothetical protein
MIADEQKKAMTVILTPRFHAHPTPVAFVGVSLPHHIYYMGAYATSRWALQLVVIVQHSVQAAPVETGASRNGLLVRTAHCVYSLSPARCGRYCWVGAICSSSNM